jgi:integrase
MDDIIERNLMGCDGNAVFTFPSLLPIVGAGIVAIVKRDGKSGVRYQVRVYVTDPLTGKRSQRTVGTFRTRREAEKCERTTIIERDAGTLGKPTRATISELLDQWVMAELPRTVEPENRPAYEVMVEKHLKPRFGGVQVNALTVEMVEAFYADLLSIGKSTSLIKKCHLRLSAALKMAKRYGYVARVVTDEAKVPSVRHKQGEVWTSDEVAHFLGAAEDDSLTPIWRLALESGARTSELLGVKWSDFDPAKGILRFGRQVVRMNRGTPIIRVGGKTASAERVNRLTPELVEVLKLHRKAQTERRLAAVEWIDNDLIFATRTGRPINTRAFRRSFDRITEDAGIQNIGPHGMRRTAITLTIAAGANVKAVSRRVGHSDVATTIGIYQRITADMDDELESIVARIVSAKSTAEADEPMLVDVI